MARRARVVLPFHVHQSEYEYNVSEIKISGPLVTLPQYHLRHLPNTMGRASPPPTLPVARDYAPVATSSSPPNEHEKLPSTSTRASTDSDTTATHSSDEFNWSDDSSSGPKNGDIVKAKRGRLIYLAFIKLSRWIRVLIIGILGCAILITPLLVVQLRFKELASSVRTQVHVWSLWLTIIWAAACATYLVVDAIPRLIVGLIVLFGGQLERLKMQIEVFTIPLCRFPV